MDIFKPFRNALADFEITDVYFSVILPELEIEKETDIVIVNTGIKTLDGIQEISDVGYLKLIGALNEQDISVLGINYEFQAEPGTKLFETVQTYLSSMNIVLSKNIEIKDINNNDDKLNYTDYNWGFNNLIDSDKKETNTVRRFNSRNIIGNDTVYHFGIELVRQYNPDAIKRLLARDKESERINFRGNWNKFEIIDVTQVLKGDFDEGYFTNKIVLTGVIDTTGTSDDFSRLYYTPLNETTSGRTFPDMYETIILANIISMLVTDDYFTEISSLVSLLVTFVLCYFNMVIFGYIGYRAKKYYEILAVLIFMIESFGVAFLTVNLFYSYQIELDLTIVILATALTIVVYELYTDSIKPFAEEILYKFGKKPKSFTLE
jgi:CHASE2 domain-containing sensor protein